VLSRVNTTLAKPRGQRIDNCLDVMTAAKFRNEAPGGLQGSSDSGDDVAVSRHPVQCCVTEHRIKFILKRQTLTVGNPRVQTELSRGGYHLWARVHRHHVAAQAHQLRGKGSVPTAEVKDPFAGFWRQQVDDTTT